MALFLAGLGVTAQAKSISWNNASGDGLWNTTSTNWTVNPYADGDTVTFDAAIRVGPVLIPGTVAPGAIIVRGTGFGGGATNGTPFVFSGADITGPGSLSVIQDKYAFFMQDNLSFTGGTFLTSNGAQIRFLPPSAGVHEFGKGPISISYPAVTFLFGPSVAGASLSNDFIITAAGSNVNWQNMTPANGGILAGTVTINPGSGLNLGSGVLSPKTILKGNATINIGNNSGTTGYLNGQIVSDETGPHNLTLQSSGNGDHRTQVSGSLPWALRNVDRKVSANWGTLFIDNESVLFTALAANNGVFRHISGSTAFGPIAAPNMNPTINFPLVFNGGGLYGASTITLNLIAGGSLSGSGALRRSTVLNNPVFTTNVNVNLNPGSVFALSGGTLTGLLSLNGGAVSNGNGAATVDNGTNVTILFNSGANRFDMAGSGNVTAGSGRFGRTAGNGATALFTGAGLGSTGKVTANGATAFNVGGLLPWALAGTGEPDTYAIYDAANGVVPLSAYDATDDLSNPGNVDLTIANAVGAGDPDRSVNALRLSSGGGVTLDAARTLTLSSGGLLALAGNGGIAGGTLAFGAAEAVLHTPGNLSVSSALTGSGGLTKDGSGSLSLGGANALGAGATAVNAGWLVAGAANVLGAGPLTIQPGAGFDLGGYDQTVGGLRDNAGYALGGLLTNSGAAATLTLANSGSQTFSGTVDGPLALVKNGAGSQTLLASNTFTLGATLNAGTLALGHDNAIGGGGLVINGGTLAVVGGARTLTNALTVNGDFAIVGSTNLTLTAPVLLTASRTLTVSNTGLTTLSGGLSEDSAGRAFTKAGAGTLILPAASTYSGTTLIRDGALRADEGTSLPSSSLLVFYGGTAAALETSGSFTRTLGTSAGQVQWLGHGGFAARGGPLTVQLNGNESPVTWGSGSFAPATNYLNLGSVTADSITDFRNGLNLNNGERVLNAIDNPASTSDVSVISGVIANGSVSKGNTGTLRLTGANTYAGGTYFKNAVGGGNGIVEIDNDSALGGGPIYIGYGYTATLRNVGPGAVTLTNKVNQTGGGGQSLVLGGNDFNLTGDVSLNNGQGHLTAQAGAKAVFSGSLLSVINTVNGPGTLEFTGPVPGGIMQLTTSARVGMGTTFGTNKTVLTAQYGVTLYAIGGPRTFANPIALGGYGGNYITFTGTNTMTFNGAITDESGGSNRGYDLNTASGLQVVFGGTVNGIRGNTDNYYRKAGSGLLVLSGANPYNLRTFVAGGVLRANDGVGLPTTSYLRLDGGVLEGNGAFIRSLAAHPANTANGDSQFRWNGSAGFSAFGGPLSVDVNGGGAGVLTWGSTANFLAAGQALVLGSAFADSAVTLVDHLALNGAVRTVQVDDNPGSANDCAILAGDISGTGSAGLLKTGNGTLFLNGTNSFTNVTTVAAGGIGGDGSLAGRLALNANTRFDAVIGQTLDVGSLTLGADCTLTVAGGGTGVILTHSGSRSGEFAILQGLGRRVVRYDANEIRITYPSGTLIQIN